MRQPSFFALWRDILILPFTVTVIVPYAIYHAAPGWLPSGTLSRMGGGLLLCAGLALLSFTIYLFYTQGKGTHAPWEPTQRLVISGPYRYCRNPMISGVLFILIGESLILHSNPILIWSGLFFIINTLYFIFKEEPDLEKRFGEAYVHYKQRVPRWIPNLKPYLSKQDM